MINHQDLINEINSKLIKYYPVKITFKNINNLTHYGIYNTTIDKYIPFNFDINGNILSGEYKSSKIIEVQTLNRYSWKKYILLYLSFYSIIENPYIDKKNTVLEELHKKNKIDILCINKLVIKNKNNIFEIDCIYNDRNFFTPFHIPKIIKIKKDNHFYFSSFMIDRNKEEIRSELMRLFINRDKYKSIHIHLNRGGDSSPGNLIVRCLVGQLEEWMTPTIKIQDNTVYKLDIWNEDKIGVMNYGRLKELNLDFTVNYFTKYTGKIHLYIDGIASAAWYLVTYLIYSFSSKIKRFTKKYYGQNLKFGSISKDSQLILHGQSLTCSGDGNPETINYNDIHFEVPKMQRLDKNGPIKNKDFGRFWIGN
jgi:hypothetical protein